jgi:hypothetical protein
MAITYEPLASVSLTGAAQEITFGSIPNTYTDLVVNLVATASGGNSDVIIYFNGSGPDLWTGYSRAYLYGKS